MDPCLKHASRRKPKVHTVGLPRAAASCIFFPPFCMSKTSDEAVTAIAAQVAQFMEKYAPAFPESTWPQMSQDMIDLVMVPTAQRAHIAGKREAFREVCDMLTDMHDAL